MCFPAVLAPLPPRGGARRPAARRRAPPGSGIDVKDWRRWHESHRGYVLADSGFFDAIHATAAPARPTAAPSAPPPTREERLATIYEASYRNRRLAVEGAQNARMPQTGAPSAPAALNVDMGKATMSGKIDPDAYYAKRRAIFEAAAAALRNAPSHSRP